MGMDMGRASAAFGLAAQNQVESLKIFDDFLENMRRAGIPADREALTGRLEEVREMVAQSRKIETLREFHGAINVGKEANSEAEFERGIKKLAQELRQHEKVRKDLERMEKCLSGRMQNSRPAPKSRHP